YARKGPKNRKAARDVGVGCVAFGIRPEQVIEYWKNPDNIGFTNMKFPTLQWLGSESNLDRAACSIKPVKGSAGTGAAARGHSYDNPDELHPDLRPALAKAGHASKVEGWSNRKLLTVQNAAKAIVSGRRPGMSDDLRLLAESVEWVYRGGG
ncbi:unnamed protein product, partial [marine sediment metagenome]